MDTFRFLNALREAHRIAKNSRKSSSAKGKNYRSQVGMYNARNKTKLPTCRTRALSASLCKCPPILQGPSPAHTGSSPMEPLGPTALTVVHLVLRLFSPCGYRDLIPQQLPGCPQGLFQNYLHTETSRLPVKFKQMPDLQVTRTEGL